jgi:hypothetical protein
MISYSVGEYTEVLPNELVIGQIYRIFNKCNTYTINTTTVSITGKYIGHDSDGNPVFNTLSVWPNYPCMTFVYETTSWSFNVFETYKDKMKKARSRMHKDVFPYDYSLKEELMRIRFTIFHILGTCRSGFSLTGCTIKFVFSGYDASLKNHAVVLLLVVQFCRLFHV